MNFTVVSAESGAGKGGPTGIEQILLLLGDFHLVQF